MDDCNYQDGYAETKTIVAEGPQVRPWARYWARMLDLYLFSITFGLIFGIVILLIPDLKSLNINANILAALGLLLWAFVETLLLSTWGFTPGKFLFNIYVRDAETKKLKMAPAFARSIAVWIMGAGCGIPIASFITMVMSHGKLMREGKTKWDSNGNFLIIHKKIGWVRIMVAVICFIVLFGFNVLSYMV